MQMTKNIVILIFLPTLDYIRGDELHVHQCLHSYWQLPPWITAHLHKVKQPLSLLHPWTNFWSNCWTINCFAGGICRAASIFSFRQTFMKVLWAKFYFDPIGITSLHQCSVFLKCFRRSPLTHFSFFEICTISAFLCK